MKSDLVHDKYLFFRQGNIIIDSKISKEQQQQQQKKKKLEY